MRHSLAIAFVVLTTASFAHAERYNVRDSKTGRFVKLSTSRELVPVKATSTALVPVKAESKALVPVSARKELAPIEKIEAPQIASASLKSKGTFFGWLKNNFTVSRSTSDHMVAANALRKEGRVGDAVKMLDSAPAPRGFLERLVVGRTTAKVRNASIAEMKEGARVGDAQRALAGKEALDGLKDTMGVFARMKANRAEAKSQSLALSAARRAGGNYDLDAASSHLGLAADLGASEKALDRGLDKLGKQAMKQAAAYARHGMVQEAAAALEHASRVPGSSISDEKIASIMTKAATVRMKGLVTLARRYYNGGQLDQAAAHLLELHDLRNQSAVELTGSSRRELVRLTAVLSSRMETLRVQELAAKDERNDVDDKEPAGGQAKSTSAVHASR